MLSQREKNVLRVYALFFSIFLPVTAIVAVFAIWHPIGWVWSLSVATAVYIAGIRIAVKLARRFWSPAFEEDAIALQDKLMGSNREPPKTWFMGPF